MRNPLRDEGSAFHLVLATLAAAVLVGVASWIEVWLGVAALVLVALAAAWAVRGAVATERRWTARPVGDGINRVLVVANETVEAPDLLEAVRARVGAPGRALVVAPALNTRLRTWTSDEDDARAAAGARLAQTLAALRGSGLDVDGRVGDTDPVQAAEDALRDFPADEIVVSTHPPGNSNWLERGVVESLRERFGLPVTHVVATAPEAEAQGPRRRRMSVHR